MLRILVQVFAGHTAKLVLRNTILGISTPYFELFDRLLNLKFKTIVTAVATPRATTRQPATIMPPWLIGRRGLVCCLAGACTMHR